ncbi:MAG: GDP-mannose 4,6-dehydratase, partial [Candidatus Tectomicrobia bacterium]|nr:GDP-mannose 4,6-dehydratase [Candidatus Tectomicrobia bacterium]
LESYATGRRENLQDVLEDIELLDHPQGVLDPRVCERAAAGVSCILHQAAIPSVPRSIEDPVRSDQVNAGGTLNMLEAARKAGARRFIYASSSSVYGDAPGEVRRESARPSPLSPYAVSKLTAELYAALYHRLHGLETVGLRYFNVFGPRQDPHSAYAAVVPIFTRRLLAGERPTIYGDGEQSRDFTYVDNAVHGNLLALKAGRAQGEVATGECHTVNELFAALRDLTGAEGLEPLYAPARPGDVRNSLADISRTTQQLGYSPAVGFAEGLRRTVAWHAERAPRGARR